MRLPPPLTRLCTSPEGPDDTFEGVKEDYDIFNGCHKVFWNLPQNRPESSVLDSMIVRYKVPFLDGVLVIQYQFYLTATVALYVSRDTRELLGSMMPHLCGSRPAASTVVVPLGTLSLPVQGHPKKAKSTQKHGPTQAPGAPWAGTLSTPRVPGQTKESGSTQRVMWEPNPFISTKSVQRKPYTPNGREDGTHSFHPK